MCDLCTLIKGKGSMSLKCFRKRQAIFFIAVGKVKVGKVAVPFEPYDVFHLHDLKTLKRRQYDLLLFGFLLPVVAHDYFVAVKQLFVHYLLLHLVDGYDKLFNA